MSKLKFEVIDRYLAPLTTAQLTQKENWELLKKSGAEIQSDLMVRVLDNYQLFCTALGREEVDKQLYATILTDLQPIASWMAEWHGEFDQEANDAMVRFFKGYTLPHSKAALAFLETAKIKRSGDFKALFDNITSTTKSNLFDGSNVMGDSYLTTFMIGLNHSDDREILEGSIKLLDERFDSEYKNYGTLTTVGYIKSAFYAALGDEEGRERCLEKVQEYFKMLENK